jgi:hypothetical protein
LILPSFQFLLWKLALYFRQYFLLAAGDGFLKRKLLLELLLQEPLLVALTFGFLASAATPRCITCWFSARIN